jgi:hypothetical protein
MFICRNRQFAGRDFSFWRIKISRAELVLSAFSGISDTYDSNLHLNENNGNSLTFHAAAYHTSDFNSPQYYAGRLAYFLSRESHWGFGLEFFHSKVYLDTERSFHVTGTRGGLPVNDTEPASDTFYDFNCSHGLNYLTTDAFYRFFSDSLAKVSSAILNLISVPVLASPSRMSRCSSPASRALSNTNSAVWECKALPA